ncbi:uncharacterized protein EKO05_0004419 [Ascochyta rabiei]|uniref:uncharacterized protein n=1 Tax=Didymella rabiei TaxID=5454 RepID=UPI0018FF7ECD|nr:uncharacterized protein EKO05_0004419 [Ascochyta rabiei]UPX13924.1 hypothetical protein EKO05_0004419 [Ascochyta rabiei]
MRLLNVKTYKLHTFYGDKIPKYAILSHTWLQDHEEVTFNHLEHQLSSSWNHLPGARKIELTCRQAAADGHSWAWIDTCCIDKANSSELSEAINSMFIWYRDAAVCYAFLMDIDRGRQDDMLCSRWWTRAWTLQELLAPKSVRFFDTNWRYIGTKADMAERISHATNIDIDTLRSSEAMFSKSVAQRLSWTAHREATRAEDLAYSLLGLFQINMAMQYGEGGEAFLRLQREIVHTTDDLSIFAWNPAFSTLQDVITVATYHGVSRLGMFAPHPSRFEKCKDIEFFPRHIGDVRIEEQHGNLTLHAPVVSYKEHRISDVAADRLPTIYWIALLPCGVRGKPYMLIGLLLSAYHQNGFSSHAQLQNIRAVLNNTHNTRSVATFLVDSEHIVKAKMMRIRVDSGSRMSRFQNAGRATAVRRKLTVRSVTNQISAPKVIGRGEWSIITNNPYTLSQDEDQDGKDIAHPLVLRFSTRSPDQYLYVFVRVRRTADDKDHIRMYTGPRAAQGIEDFILDIDWAADNSSIGLSGEDMDLFAKIKTCIVYNQAVSTLTIKERRSPQDKDSDDSEGSAHSARAVVRNNRIP